MTLTRIKFDWLTRLSEMHRELLEIDEDCPSSRDFVDPEFYAQSQKIALVREFIASLNSIKGN